jgi:hypothetical protein
VSRASISSDIQYLGNQTKESIREYVTEHLPEQYQVCLSAFDTILKHAYEILETTDDNREKLQAMELFKDTHLVNCSLCVANPIAARPASDPWFDGHEIPDHWDAESAA